MRIRFLSVFVAIVAALTLAAAAQTGPAQTLLEAAKKKDVVDGDVKGAIQQYQLVVDHYAKTDRAAAAQALLRMAECYQKIGDAQARRVYEQLVRDYGSQPEAAVARARLGPVAARDTKMLRRQLWTGRKAHDAGGTISGDGRLISFTDPDTGGLAIHDLGSGADTRVTDVGHERAGVDFAQGSIISRDGSKIAYSWWVNGTKNSLRVVDLTAGKSPSPRVLLDNREIDYVAPFDWSPRGDWVAVQVKRADGTAQIGVVSIADGGLRILKSVDWRGVTGMSISPDAAFIAYDLPIGESTARRDVFVLSSDGRREAALNTRPAYNTVVGWSPDGKSLLFASERSGSMGLWTVAVPDGRPQGSPHLVDPDLGTFFGSLGITRSGSLVFLKKVNAINVYTAALDFATGKVIAPPEPITDGYLLNHTSPLWSPDGKFLAYMSQGRAAKAITIRSLETGQMRELTPRMSSFSFASWSAAKFITFQGSDLKGRQGIYGLDTETGATSQIVVGGGGEGYLSHASATPDGKSVVYTRNKAGTLALLVRDRASGQERVLANSVATATAVSPDGRLVAYRTGDQTSQSIMVVPIEGGSPRALLKVTRPPGGLAHRVAWLPDSRRLIIGRSEGDKESLVVVPLDGGAPVSLALTPNVVGPYFRVHPDGRRIAYSEGDPAFEVWTLENFLPVANRK